MKKKENKKTEEEGLDIDFGIGKISLGGLFKGIEKFVGLAERVEQAGGELKKSGTIKGLGGNRDARGVYGFTVRTGLGKKTKIESFGNIKKTKQGPKVAKTREPIVDLFDEKNHILIIVEVPGIDEKSIKVNLKKDILLLEAGSQDRKYVKEILLPAKIDFASREVNFKNGILELKFKKAKATEAAKAEKSKKKTKR